MAFAIYSMQAQEIVANFNEGLSVIREGGGGGNMENVMKQLQETVAPGT